MNGWIKLHRSLLSWEWWDDKNTTRVWIWLLLNANHEAARWKGVDIAPGQLVTSYARISEATGLTIREVRTALSHLKKTENVTSYATNKFQVISIVNWAGYQAINKTPCDKLTEKRQEKDSQVATNKKEEKENKARSKNLMKKPYGEFLNVFLSDDELEKLKLRFADYENRIEKLSIYMETRGAQYKNHYATIISWAQKESPSTGAHSKNDALRAAMRELKGDTFGQKRDTQGVCLDEQSLDELQAAGHSGGY